MLTMSETKLPAVISACDEATQGYAASVGSAALGCRTAKWRFAMTSTKLTGCYPMPFLVVSQH